MTQASLFDSPVATYRAGTLAGSQATSPTSREAARSIDAEVGIRQLEVLRALVVLREATANEIADRIGREWYVVRPRLSGMQIRGFVCQTGERRSTPTGRRAAVLKLTAAGIKHLNEQIGR